MWAVAFCIPGGGTQSCHSQSKITLLMTESRVGKKGNKLFYSGVGLPNFTHLSLSSQKPLYSCFSHAEYCSPWIWCVKSVESPFKSCTPTVTERDETLAQCEMMSSHSKRVMDCFSVKHHDQFREICCFPYSPWISEHKEIELHFLKKMHCGCLLLKSVAEKSWKLAEKLEVIA